MKKSFLVNVVLVTAFLSSAPVRVLGQGEITGDPGSELVISLVTMGPGPLVWERFGHNAISVRDTREGTDRWYNYGLFDFAQDNFILNFVQGRMRYWMDDTTGTGMLSAYVRAGRSVWIQELNLTPAQRLEFKNFLEWNDLDANRFYRYDYYWDNCSTRVRDAMDRILGGVIEAQTDTVIVAHTFRTHTERLTTNNPPIYTGLMLGLGPMVDKPLTAWDEMFLPLAMRERVREITVVSEDGSTAPLVKSETTLFESDMWPVDDAPPKWHFWYALIGLAIAVVLFLATRHAPRSRWHRGAFGVLIFLWTLVVGVFGMGLFSLWAFTDHVVSYRNENLFLFNPLWFALAILLVPAFFRAQWSVRGVKVVSLTAGAAMILGFVAQVLPGMDQSNSQLYELVFLPNFVALYGLIQVYGGGVPLLAKVLGGRSAG